MHLKFTFLSPLTNLFYTAVSWVLLRWHQFFTLLGMPRNGGLTWSLSIVFLVITARLLLFRFFIKQVHYTRHMQKMAPEIAKLKEKHKGDKQAQQRAMMELQQEQGLNMLAGCLPMLLQIPVFISLFHVLRHLANASQGNRSTHNLTLYGFSQSETLSAARAKLFGAPLASSFHDKTSKVIALGGDLSTVRTVTIVLALISAGATFVTQRQSTRNAPTPPTGQAAQIQKLMLYIIPVMVLGSGVFFPLGVLLYWFTSNLWTMGQQFYIYRYHPVDEAPAPAPVGVVGKSLAPKPGAKPVANRDRRPSISGATAVSTVNNDPRPTARSSTPRPGARPTAGKAAVGKPAVGKPAVKRPAPRNKKR